MVDVLEGCHCKTYGHIGVADLCNMCVALYGIVTAHADEPLIAALRTAPYFIERMPAYDVEAIAAMRPFKILGITNDPDAMVCRLPALLP